MASLSSDAHTFGALDVSGRAWTWGWDVTDNAGMMAAPKRWWPPHTAR